VQLRSRAGEWFTVRLDMEVAGALLLRDPKGSIYAIETEGLPQVDLSDDYVLLMLFTDGSWQDQMQVGGRAGPAAASLGVSARGSRRSILGAAAPEHISFRHPQTPPHPPTLPPPNRPSSTRTQTLAAWCSSA